MKNKTKEQTTPEAESSSTGRKKGECALCEEEKILVSGAFCDACRKAIARQRLNKEGARDEKRQAAEERDELRRKLRIYQSFQEAFLQLRVPPKQTAHELSGLLRRVKAFEPVLHLLNPSGSGHNEKSSVSTSTPSTQTATAPNGATAQEGE